MTKKILIADDEVHILNLIKLTLGEEYDFLEAFDGEEVLEILKTETPDLILLDIMMPKLDGYTVCKKIKQNPKLKNIPIVLVSAKVGEQDILFGVDLGASAYITKPFNKTDFEDTVKNLLQ